MLKRIAAVFCSAVLLMMSGCGNGTEEKSAQSVSQSSSAETQTAVNDVSTTKTTAEMQEESSGEDILQMMIGGTAVNVEWEDNESVQALKELVKDAPLTINMSMYGGFEQVGSIGNSLPRNDKQTSTSSGDIVLYSGNQIVVFYGSNSWSYTRLGKVTDKSDDEMRELLGNGDTSISFQINTSDIVYTVQDIRNLSDFLLARPTEEDLNGKPYDLNGDEHWDVFDLCLMKRKVLEQRGMKNEFDFESKTVLLNSGYEMPIIGLGTWTQDDETTEESVYAALKDGYHLIDTAQYYGNETGVGNGLKRAMADGIVTREEVFITTKVMPSNYDRAYQSIDESLKRLGVDYIDLMLIHQSGSKDTEVYKALCQGVKDGKLRSIGISNYYTPEEFERVTAEGGIKPAVVQNENHPFYQNTEFKDYVSQYGTVVESWYPFGGRSHTQDLFGNETIATIAAAHGKTSAQIILRWHLQAGYVTIPGSQNPDHILENFSIFDFELNDEEMQRMAELHTGQRYENW